MEKLLTLRQSYLYVVVFLEIALVTYAKLHSSFYALETYILHFLEPGRFLNAPDLAGCKVNVLYAPLSFA